MLQAVIPSHISEKTVFRGNKYTIILIDRCFSWNLGKGSQISGENVFPGKLMLQTVRHVDSIAHSLPAPGPEPRSWARPGASGRARADHKPF